MTANTHDISSFLSSALLVFLSNTTGASHWVSSRCSPRVGGSSSREPILLAHSALALTCALFPTIPFGRPVFVVNFPFALSWNLAALGLRVFERSHITCRRNCSLSRHYISARILTFLSSLAYPFDVAAVATSTWSWSMCHGRSVFAFIFEVVIIRYDKDSTWSWDSSHDRYTCKNITWSHVILG